MEQLYELESMSMPPDDSDQEHPKTITKASGISSIVKPWHAVKTEAEILPASA